MTMPGLRMELTVNIPPGIKVAISMSVFVETRMLAWQRLWSILANNNKLLFDVAAEIYILAFKSQAFARLFSAIKLYGGK